MNTIVKMNMAAQANQKKAVFMYHLLKRKINKLVLTHNHSKSLALMTKSLGMMRSP